MYILIFFGLISTVSAVEIEMKEGKENRNSFSTLNLRGDEAVNCKKIFDDFKEISEIECRFTLSYNQKLRDFSNSFFDVKVETHPKYTAIRIFPRYYARLFSSDEVIPDLKYFIPKKESSTANHWLIVGYKTDNPPFITEKNIYNPTVINFPISLDFKKEPFIGALDISGNPIKKGEAEDVKGYMELRKEFEDGHYRNVLEKSSFILKNYPNTLFRPEIILYKIRSLFKLKAHQQIINVAKDFLRNYSSDSAVPEVLLYTAYIHSKLGFLSYAKYYFVRLFEEHKDSEYRNMGYIYYGDDRIYGGKKSEGIKLYKKALYNTKDKLIATKAAYRLGNIYLKDLKPDKSEKYLSKVVAGNPEYFSKNVPANYKLAKTLAHHKKKAIAADIMNAMLEGKGFNDFEDSYEVMLKDEAIWLDESGRIEEAYREYEKYIQTYDYGMFDKIVRKNQDRLLFLRDENSTSKRFTNYNKLIKTYGLDSDIGKQAIYEKGKLLHDINEFAMVLELEDDLEVAKEKFPETINIINNSAIQEAIQSLNREIEDNYIEPVNVKVDSSTVEEKRVISNFARADNKKQQSISNCENAINLIDKYKIELPNNEDEKLYHCSMKTGKYQLSQNIVKRNITSGEDTLNWVYRQSQILLKTGKYKKFIEVSDEVISLMNVDGNDRYLEIYYDRFKAFDILRRDSDVIKTVVKLDKYYRDTYRNLQPFKSVVSIGKSRKDNLIIEKFAKRVIKIQYKLNSFVETPAIELLLITSLKYQNKISESITVAKKLLKRDISDDTKARTYYEIGVAEETLGNESESKKNFSKSYKASPTNVWGKLSKDYLDF